MKLVSALPSSYEELAHDQPTLYKYRSWTNPLHKGIITEQAVFMAAPNTFEDTLDCKLNKRFDLLTNEEIFAMYLENSREENIGFSPEEHNAFALEWTAKSPMKDPEHLKQFMQDYAVDFSKVFGVLCLTANPQLEEMWTKYSDGHRGICVGFNSKILFSHLGGGGKVIYSETLPDIHPLDSLHEEHHKQVFYKEKKWAFEEEYRTHKFYPHEATIIDRKIILPKECYSKIIFGLSTPENQRQEIIAECAKQNLAVTFHEQTGSQNNLVLQDYISKGT